MQFAGMARAAGPSKHYDSSPLLRWVESQQRLKQSSLKNSDGFCCEVMGTLFRGCQRFCAGGQAVGLHTDSEYNREPLWVVGQSPACLRAVRCFFFFFFWRELGFGVFIREDCPGTEPELTRRGIVDLPSALSLIWPVCFGNRRNGS